MKKQIIEHILSIIFIAIIFTVLFILLSPADPKLNNSGTSILSEDYKIENLDYENPLQKSLLKETLHIFYTQDAADSLLSLYESEYYEKLTTNNNQSKSDIRRDKLLQILFMFLKFVFVYVLVLGLTYYGVQTLAVFRFVAKKQNKPPMLIRAVNNLKNLNKGVTFKNGSQKIFQSILYLIKALVKVLMYLILFSPAYVIAYSFKTKFDTDSIVFMIILGVISNALLINYSQKFYTFLVTESNKGYVETAIVKNLKNDYGFETLQISSILNFKKIFLGHVFNHIFINAQHQYYSTIKEQAAFLITGLIIIEMALNIHGHLSYELMQNLLFQKYQLVLIIVFLIYLTIKSTEIFVDIFILKQDRKYQNS